MIHIQQAATDSVIHTFTLTLRPFCHTVIILFVSFISRFVGSLSVVGPVYPALTSITGPSSVIGVTSSVDNVTRGWTG